MQKSLTETGDFVVTLSLNRAKQRRLTEHSFVRLVTRFNRCVAVETPQSKYERLLKDICKACSSYRSSRSPAAQR